MITEEINKEGLFKNYADVFQSIIGYHKHPKCILIKITKRMYCHALNIAEELISRVGQKTSRVFSLVVD